MSTLSDPPKGAFRLSMLLNDSRYRSLTLQAIAAIVLALIIFFLANNVANNLARLGLDIDFEFLGAPAGYDINQRLIDYTSQSSNLRAAFVGILNTLLVAVLACITATVLGVLAGVFRLSNNWVVSKLMAVYVEIFRNIPLLIWILVIYGIMTVVLPAPNTFRGDDATSSMFLGISAFTNRGVYIPGPEFSRIFGETGILSAAIGWLIALAILIGSFFGARAVTKRATSIQEATGERPATLITNLAIWFLPLIAFFIVTGLNFDIPELKGFNFKGGVKIGAPLIALWLALSVYTGAFIAENVRAGIQAVSKGQSEAAAALGIQSGLITRLVVLPQALRIIIPPMISNYLNITKNTSLAILVGYADVTATLGGITLNQTGRAIECIVLLMLFYLVISLTISGLANIYNNSNNLKER